MTPTSAAPNRPVRYVDVFGSGPMLGNAVAVVLDGEGLSDAELAAYARWTNLSETTFVLPPTRAGVDYRVRIWTPDGELPFAGHPTLGTCHAWLEAGGRSASSDVVVQECAAGLVRVRRGEVLAFAAPPLIRSGPVEPDVLAQAALGLGLDPADVLDAAWVDNGPGWLGLLLRDAAAVLGVRPDIGALGDLKPGVVGAYPPGSECAVEVRAFYPGLGGAGEDPVTGSLNAGLAEWLIGTGVLPPAYVASQGSALLRAGRVHVERVDGQVWVGGTTTTLVTGHLAL